MKPLLVIGGRGQLARSLYQLRPDALFLDRNVMDLAHPEDVAEVLERYDASAVINAAAYTQVDQAEIEEGLATRINAGSPTAMAIYCASRNIPFIHFSTDYVFNGSGETAWKENDIPQPLNAYGRSKLAGEEAITHIGGNYLIFRTSWVYDATGKNFFNTILRLSKEREELSIINDQYGAPTYAPHLGYYALSALEKAGTDAVFPSGIYHLCNAGVTTWYHFACKIVDFARKEGKNLKVNTMKPISSSEYITPAARPRNSRLDCTKLASVFGVQMPDWEQGLKECITYTPPSIC